MSPKNILSNFPAKLDAEIFETIIQTNNLTIERIISQGQQSPPGFWYDQDRDEWVMVIQGQARLRFEQEDDVIEMGPGDYVNIPAHCRHRVEWTDPNQLTIWLAVHYR